MAEKDQRKNDIQVQSPSSADAAVDIANSPPESTTPRPEPSYGEITEGESGASLWQTLKMALRE